MADVTRTETLGGRLQAGRDEAGMSQDTAAALIEVPLATLLAWEANEERPTLDRMAKAAFVYGIDFVELLTADRVPA